MKQIDPNKIVRIHNNDTDYWYTVSWKMTDWCNFHCPYCIANSACRENMPSQTKLEQYAEKLANYLGDVYHIPPGIKLHLVGGEPSFFNLIKIVDILNQKQPIGKISLVTNFSAPMDKYVEFNNWCKEHDIFLKLVASYHEEFGEKSEFLEKMKEYKSLGGTIRLSELVNEDGADVEFLNQTLDAGIYANTPRERDLDNNMSTISDDTLEYLQSIEEDKPCIQVFTPDDVYYFKCAAFANNAFIGEGFRPTGYKCTAGITCLRVEPNGNVCRSGCAYCKVEHIVGNLNNDLSTFKPIDGPIICGLADSKKCNLSYRVNISKPYAL